MSLDGLINWLLVYLPVGVVLLLGWLMEKRDHNATKAEYSAFRKEVDQRNNRLIEDLGKGLDGVATALARLEK